MYDASFLPELVEINYFEDTVCSTIKDDFLYTIDYIKPSDSVQDSTIVLKKYSLDLSGNTAILDSLELNSSCQIANYNIPRLQIYNDILYVKTEGHLYSISTEGSELTILGNETFDLNSGITLSTKKFIIFDNYLYGNDGEYWDISDPHNTVYMGSWAEGLIDQYYIQFIGTMSFNNDLLCTPIWEGGFKIIDISDPNDFQVLYWHQNLDYFSGVAIKDDYLFVASWFGISVIDIINPANPVNLNLFETNSYCYEIIIEDNNAFVGTNNGMLIFDIINPENPELIRSINMNSINEDIEKHGDYIYGIGCGYTGNWLTITNVSDVNNASIELQLHDNNNLQNMVDMTILNDILYIADYNVDSNSYNYSGGLRIYDLSNPINPVYITTINPEETTWFYSVSGKDNILYLSGIRHNNYGYYGPQTWVIDVEQPENPQILNVLDDEIIITKSVIDGDYRYVSGSGGEAVYNISDPTNPVLLDSFIDHSGGCRDIIERNGYIFSAKDKCVNIYSTEHYNSSISEDQIQTNNELFLSQNYPNPFNPITTISFNIPSSRFAELTIYNVIGQKVNTLINNWLTEGHHSIYWNGQDSKGSKCGSGLYFYRLTTKGSKITKKMMLLK